MVCRPIGPSRIGLGDLCAEECLKLLLALAAGLPAMCTLPLLAGENIWTHNGP